jgi:predicted glycoside hydrolase/deacetylase ChbG (UPF0249 family)
MGTSLYTFDRVVPPSRRLWPANREHKSSRKLAERIGFSVLDPVLIVNCDDLGSSHSANLAVERALRHGIASSATLMVPCPWAQLAAEACRDLDIGIHLTLTSEYPAYRWPSLTGGRSLHDKSGYLPKSIQEVWARADLQEVEQECRAQIDQAIEWGVDVTHLDCHMDTLQLDRHYFDVYMRLAKDYRLPLRLRRPSLLFSLSYISGTTLERNGIVTTDRFIAPPWGEPGRAALTRFIRNPSRGVTEIVLHPVDDGDELRAYDTEYADLRVADAQCLTDSSLCASIVSQNINRISYRPLREAMRRATESVTSGH